MSFVKQVYAQCFVMHTNVSIMYLDINPHELCQAAGSGSMGRLPASSSFRQVSDALMVLWLALLVPTYASPVDCSSQWASTPKVTQQAAHVSAGAAAEGLGIGDANWGHVTYTQYLNSKDRGTPVQKNEDYLHSILLIEYSIAQKLFPGLEPSQQQHKWQQGLVWPGPVLKRPKLELADLLVLKANAMLELGRHHSTQLSDRAIDLLHQSEEALKLAAALIHASQADVPETLQQIEATSISIGQTAADSLQQLSPSTMKAMLSHYGTTCDGCSTNRSWVEALVTHLDLPVTVSKSRGGRVQPTAKAITANTYTQKATETPHSYSQFLFARLQGTVQQTLLKHLRVPCRTVDQRTNVCLSYLPTWVPEDAIERKATYDSSDNSLHVNNPGYWTPDVPKGDLSNDHYDSAYADAHHAIYEFSDLSCNNNPADACKSAASSGRQVQQPVTTDNLSSLSKWVFGDVKADLNKVISALEVIAGLGSASAAITGSCNAAAAAQGSGKSRSGSSCKAAQQAEETVRENGQAGLEQTEDEILDCDELDNAVHGRSLIGMQGCAHTDGRCGQGCPGVPASQLNDASISHPAASGISAEAGVQSDPSAYHSRRNDNARPLTVPLTVQDIRHAVDRHLKEQLVMVELGQQAGHDNPAVALTLLIVMIFMILGVSAAKHRKRIIRFLTHVNISKQVQRRLATSAGSAVSAVTQTTASSAMSDIQAASSQVSAAQRRVASASLKEAMATNDIQRLETAIRNAQSLGVENGQLTKARQTLAQLRKRNQSKPAPSRITAKMDASKGDVPFPDTALPRDTSTSQEPASHQHNITESFWSTICSLITSSSLGIASGLLHDDAEQHMQQQLDGFSQNGETNFRLQAGWPKKGSSQGNCSDSVSSYSACPDTQDTNRLQTTASSNHGLDSPLHAGSPASTHARCIASGFTLEEFELLQTFADEDDTVDQQETDDGWQQHVRKTRRSKNGAAEENSRDAVQSSNPQGAGQKRGKGSDTNAYGVVGKQQAGKAKHGGKTGRATDVAERAKSAKRSDAIQTAKTPVPVRSHSNGGDWLDSTAQSHTANPPSSKQQLQQADASLLKTATPVRTSANGKLNSGIMGSSPAEDTQRQACNPYTPTLDHANQPIGPQTSSPTAKSRLMNALSSLIGSNTSSPAAPTANLLDSTLSYSSIITGNTNRSITSSPAPGNDGPNSSRSMWDASNVKTVRNLDLKSATASTASPRNGTGTGNSSPMVGSRPLNPDAPAFTLPKSKQTQPRNSVFSTANGSENPAGVPTKPSVSRRLPNQHPLLSPLAAPSLVTGNLTGLHQRPSNFANLCPSALAAAAAATQRLRHDPFAEPNPARKQTANKALGHTDTVPYGAGYQPNLPPYATQLTTCQSLPTTLDESASSVITQEYPHAGLAAGHGSVQYQTLPDDLLYNSPPTAHTQSHCSSVDTVPATNINSHASYKTAGYVNNSTGMGSVTATVKAQPVLSTLSSNSVWSPAAPITDDATNWAPTNYLSNNLQWTTVINNTCFGALPMTSSSEIQANGLHGATSDFFMSKPAWYGGGAAAEEQTWGRSSEDLQINDLAQGIMRHVVEETY